MIMKITFLGLVLAASVLALNSCGVQVNTVLATDRSAHLDIAAHVHPVLLAYFKDLSGSDAPIFDTEIIKKKLTAEKGVTVQKIALTGKSDLKISLDVQDITQLFAAKSSDLRSALSLGEVAGIHTLKLHLGRTLVKTLLSLGTSGDSSAVSSLIPQKDSITTRQYQDQLNWALEEYGTAAELAAMFKSSLIKVTIKLPAPIQSATGFSIQDRTAGLVGLDIKLLDLMTLNNDLNYEVTY